MEKSIRGHRRGAILGTTRVCRDFCVLLLLRQPEKGANTQKLLAHTVVGKLKVFFIFIEHRSNALQHLLDLFPSFGGMQLQRIVNGKQCQRPAARSFAPKSSPVRTIGSLSLRLLFPFTPGQTPTKLLLLLAVYYGSSETEVGEK